MRILKWIGIVAAVAALSAGAMAQKATPEEMGTFADKSGMGVLHMNANLGSFKVIDGKGRLDVSFTGTYLITKYNGKALQIEGKIRKEYDKNGRTVFTGTGRIIAEGEWRGLEWFGKDMHAVWYGSGALRINGEFDRSFRTGDYWYEDPAEKQSWPASSVMTVYMPKPDYSGTTKSVPRERRSGGG